METDVRLQDGCRGPRPQTDLRIWEKNHLAKDRRSAPGRGPRPPSPDGTMVQKLKNYFNAEVGKWLRVD